MYILNLYKEKNYIYIYIYLYIFNFKCHNSIIITIKIIIIKEKKENIYTLLYMKIINKIKETNKQLKRNIHIYRNTSFIINYINHK